MFVQQLNPCEGYDEQNYQVGKCRNGACEQLKDEIKEKNLVM